jgi:hypothetical protein
LVKCKRSYPILERLQKSRLEFISTAFIKQLKAAQFLPKKQEEKYIFGRWWAVMPPITYQNPDFVKTLDGYSLKAFHSTAAWKMRLVFCSGRLFSSKMKGRAILKYAINQNQPVE